jgi:hypothetical protein
MYHLASQEGQCPKLRAMELEKKTHYLVLQFLLESVFIETDPLRHAICHTRARRKSQYYIAGYLIGDDIYFS